MTETVNIYCCNEIIDEFLIINDPSGKRPREIVINHHLKQMLPMLTKSKQEICNHLKQLHRKRWLEKLTMMELRQQLEILELEILFKDHLLKVKFNEELMVEFDISNNYAYKVDAQGKYVNLRHDIHRFDLIEYKMNLDEQLKQSIESFNIGSTTASKEKLRQDLAKEPYLLEIGPDFASYLIIIKQNNLLLGTAIVNVHFEHFPLQDPTIMLTSPIYFDSQHSILPSCRKLENTFMGVEQLFQSLVGEIIEFHQNLTQNAN